jgi:hypothetical protein
VSKTLLNAGASLGFKKREGAPIMAIRVEEFSREGYKIERFLAKNQLSLVK